MVTETRQPGQLIGGRYELLELVGRGGLGVVYRARDRRSGREVAVKLLGEPAGDDPAALRRLAREARIMADLSSPHIVPVYDSGVEAGRPYLVMEYLPGGTLASHVAGRLPLPPGQVVAYGRQIAAGLAVAHARGLVHRDVTLRNILVGPDGQVKLTDFGIARTADATRLTRTGTTIGTAVSMAPEQARGDAVTPATDVYGLGVVLYELATGRPPFTGENDVAVALQHVQAPVPPPRQLNPALPGWLEAVILRALAKDPADRYPDGAAIEAALAASPSPVPAATTAALPAAAEPGPTTPIARQPTAGTAVLGPAAATSAPAWRPPAAGRRWLPLLAGLAALLLVGLVALSLAGSPAADRPAAATPAPLTATPSPPTPTAGPATAVPPTATPAPGPAQEVVPAPPPAEKKDDKRDDREDDAKKRGGDRKKGND